MCARLAQACVRQYACTLKSKIKTCSAKFAYVGTIAWDQKPFVSQDPFVTHDPFLTQDPFVIQGPFVTQASFVNQDAFVSQGSLRLRPFVNPHSKVPYIYTNSTN